MSKKKITKTKKKTPTAAKLNKKNKSYSSTLSKTKKKRKVSESEFLEVLDKITKKLIHKFRFGYHSVEDMKQQASVFALEALERYDGKRPLENFLWTHVRNRLFNFKRNNYQRPDSPCIGCKFYDKHMKNSTNGCLEFNNKLDCSLYNNWFERNENKKNIMQPSYIDNEQDIFHRTMSSTKVEDKELIEYLDKNVTSEYREYYLKLKHGSKIKKEKFEKLKLHIADILKNYNHYEQE